MAASALLLVSAAAARADVAPPPTLCLDFLYLDAPYRYIVGLCMFGGAVTFGLFLRRRAVPRLLAIGVPLFLLVATDIGLYIYGISKQDAAKAEWRRQHGPPVFTNTNQPARPTQPNTTNGETEQLLVMPKAVE
jgi:hypothetical protein